MSAAKVLTSTTGLSHEDWLEYRRLGIGGSDASVVCGVNRYKSPIELWMEKNGQAPHQDAGEAAYWGTRLESMIRDEFIKRTGIEVITVSKILQSKEYAFMLANLDGVCRHPQLMGRVYSKLKPQALIKAANGTKALYLKNMFYRYSITCPSRATLAHTSPFLSAEIHSSGRLLNATKK